MKWVSTSGSGPSRTWATASRRGPRLSGGPPRAIKWVIITALWYYAKQKQGNYFSGRNGPTTYSYTIGDFRRPLEPGKKRTITVEYAPKATPGGEVPNTSKESESVLLKAVGRLEGGHSLELGFLDHDSEFGEVWPSAVRLYPLQQYDLQRSESNRCWGQYEWNPDSDLISFNANLWAPSSEEGAAEFDRIFLETSAWGFEVWNASGFGSPIGDLSLSYGGSYASSSLELPDAAEGTRRVTGAYVNLLYGDLFEDGAAFRAKLAYFDNTHSDYIVRGGRTWHQEGSAFQMSHYQRSLV